MRLIPCAANLWATDKDPPTAGRLLNQADTDTTAQLLHARKDRQSFYYNNGFKSLQPLEKGDTVRIKPTKQGHKVTATLIIIISKAKEKIIPNHSSIHNMYIRLHKRTRLDGTNQFIHVIKKMFYWFLIFSKNTKIVSKQ